MKPTPTFPASTVAPVFPAPAIGLGQNLPSAIGNRQSPIPTQWLSLLLWALLLACAFAPPACSAPATSAALPLLTNLSALRELPAREAGRGYPVRLTAVVTYVEPEGGSLFVQDSTAGIWVECRTNRPNLHQGWLVELQGVSHPGQFAPILQATCIQPLKPGTEPEAKVLALDELLTGTYDSQWVAFEGIIRAFQQQDHTLSLWVASPHGTIKALVLSEPQPAGALQLVDAEVRVRGVCGTEFNQLGQLVHIHLMVPDLGHVQILKPGPADPFDSPVKPIASLFKFRTSGISGHAVHLSGVLIGQRAGRSLVIQEAGQGLQVESSQTEPLQPGDRLEVVGFPVGGEYTPRLLQAIYRKVAPGREPEALPVRAADIIQNTTGGVVDSRLVRVQACLLAHTRTPTEELLLLQSDKEDFKAILPRRPGRDSSSAGLETLRTGSWLELTGVCLQQLDANHMIHSFELLLRRPADVRLIKAGSWWTVPRALAALGLAAFAALLTLAWVVSLRSTVRSQTRQIRRQLGREKSLARLGKGLSAAATIHQASEVMIAIAHEFFSWDAAFVLGCPRAGNGAVDFLLAEAKLEGKTVAVPAVARDQPPSPELIRLLEQAPQLVTAQAFAQLPPEILALSQAAQVAAGWTMAVPLPGAQGRGLLLIQSRQTVYTALDLEGLNNLAGHSANALERIRVQSEFNDQQQQLREVSRRAGMAEVATRILHSVGNVLTSVNVTSNLLLEKIRRSRLPYLAKAVGLLENHRGHLDEFLTADSQGKQLPEYLQALARRLSGEQAEQIKELESLQKNIDHIKEIIALQQDHARVPAVVESISINELVEDALRINADALEGRQIELQRQYGTLPPVQIQKHKVLQILVDLITNAGNALAGTARAQKKLLLRTEAVGDDCVKISVADNGVGIAPEHRDRIFSMGFTTRKTGHGFGLHNAALAARDLGATLSVHSDGPGQGATFVLELPVNPKKG